MQPEEFRAAGHQLIDWIADYRAAAPHGPVRSSVKPGEVAASLPSTPPDGTTEMAEVLQLLDSVVVPGITQLQHPRNFAWFPSNATLSSVLGDMASSGLGTLGISWESSPALTEVEQVVVDWMRQLTGLSDNWEGTIHDTASTSCLVALLVARERATNDSQLGTGLSGVDAAPVVYTTAQAHSSVRKAALLAGYGADHLRIVAHDDRFDMDVTDLAARMAEDLDAGRRPAAVVASVGTTGTTAFDPVKSIVEVSSKHGAWVHVDAAMAGTAMLVPELRHLWDGVEGADSITWNPHKWMGTVLDTSLFYVRDSEALTAVLSTNPSYLRSSQADPTVEYRDWGLPLGRRFRSLKLLFQLHLEGIESVQGRVRRDMANAAWLAAQAEAAPSWEVVAPVRLQTVCLRHTGSSLGGDPDRDEALTGEELDRHTLAWAEQVNSSGFALVTPSMLEGQWMVRVSVGSALTERVHVEELWVALQEAASQRFEERRTR